MVFISALSLMSELTVDPTHVGSCSPGVAMVNAGNPRESDDATGVRRFDSPRDRRVSVERHVRAVLVVVGGVLADQAQEMTLPEHDHMIEQLSTKSAYPPLRVAVLPRRFRRGAELFDTKVSHARVEGPAVDCVAVANQTDHVGIGADRLVSQKSSARDFRPCVSRRLGSAIVRRP